MSIKIYPIFICTYLSSVRIHDVLLFFLFLKKKYWKGIKKKIRNFEANHVIFRSHRKSIKGQRENSIHFLEYKLLHKSIIAQQPRLFSFQISFILFKVTLSALNWRIIIFTKLYWQFLNYIEANLCSFKKENAWTEFLAVYIILLAIPIDSWSG